MATKIHLVSMHKTTSFAPLGVLGYCVRRTDFLAPVFSELELPLKTVRHSPRAKLIDILVGILSGCRAIEQVNTRIRPDTVLAQAWGRESFAEQSLLADTLDAFDEVAVNQLRHGGEGWLRRNGRLFRHDFASDWLWLDIDLTPLPISKYAEASTKGKQDSSATYQPVLDTLESSLAFSAAQKQRTVVRSDAGFGGDANVNYALNANWQVLTKGKGGKRPTAYAAQVAPPDWQAMGHERWMAPSPTAPTYVQPTQHFVLCWQTASGAMKYATLVCSVPDWSMDEVLACYDDRGACETEIQADKHGLQLERRRKKRLAAQEALILLTDVAHNLLAWTGHWMFPTGPYAHFGPLRLTQDILTLPGRLYFEHDRLVEVQLNKRHPYAEPVAEALHRLLKHFGNP